jgi:large subunit ribosomal protein L10e
MGKTNVSFQYQVYLIAKEGAQVRHNALEAARTAVNRLLSIKLGDNYFLRVMPYPHQVLRENKMIFGAHADRLQDGMRGAFGKPTGSAARVRADQSLIEVGVNEDGVEIAKQALKLGADKFPIPCRIKVEKVMN